MSVRKDKIARNYLSNSLTGGLQSIDDQTHEAAISVVGHPCQFHLSSSGNNSCPPIKMICCATSFVTSFRRVHWLAWLGIPRQNDDDDHLLWLMIPFVIYFILCFHHSMTTGRCFWSLLFLLDLVLGPWNKTPSAAVASWTHLTSHWIRVTSKGSLFFWDHHRLISSCLTYNDMITLWSIGLPEDDEVNWKINQLSIGLGGRLIRVVFKKLIGYLNEFLGMGLHETRNINQFLEFFIKPFFSYIF